jgi:hypothetical protein
MISQAAKACGLCHFFKPAPVAAFATGLDYSIAMKWPCKFFEPTNENMQAIACNLH